MSGTNLTGSTKTPAQTQSVSASLSDKKDGLNSASVNTNEIGGYVAQVTQVEFDNKNVAVTQQTLLHGAPEIGSAPPSQLQTGPIHAPAVAAALHDAYARAAQADGPSHRLTQQQVEQFAALNAQVAEAAANQRFSAKETSDIVKSAAQIAPGHGTQTGRGK